MEFQQSVPSGRLVVDLGDKYASRHRQIREARSH